MDELHSNAIPAPGVHSLTAGLWHETGDEPSEAAGALALAQLAVGTDGTMRILLSFQPFELSGQSRYLYGIQYMDEDGIYQDAAIEEGTVLAPALVSFPVPAADSTTLMKVSYQGPDSTSTLIARLIAELDSQGGGTIPDETYEFPEEAEYDIKVRRLQETDPASAENTFNPLFQKIITNGHTDHLKLESHADNADIHVTEEDRRKWDSGGEDAHQHSNITVLDGITADKVTNWDGSASSSDLAEHTANQTVHVTAAERTGWNGKADASALTTHTGNNDIHITPTDRAAWNNKVDPEPGKGLSSSDYTPEEKTKLGTVAEGATKNEPSDSIPAALGIASAGRNNKFARADHIHQSPMIAETIPSGADLNSYMATGEFKTMSVAVALSLLNVPSELQYSFWMRVTKLTEHACQQTLRQVGNKALLWVRNYDNGVWGDWHQAYHSGNLPGYTAGTGLTLTGTQFAHSNTGSAGAAGPTTDVSPGNNGTFSVPQVTANAQGHVTSLSERKVTMPPAYAHPNSGVAAGDYGGVTVNIGGHVTAGSRKIISGQCKNTDNILYIPCGGFNFKTDGSQRYFIDVLGLMDVEGWGDYSIKLSVVVNPMSDFASLTYVFPNLLSPEDWFTSVFVLDAYYDQEIHQIVFPINVPDNRSILNINWQAELMYSTVTTI